jgi:hypothetical protein
LRAVFELLPPLAWFFLLYLTALAVLFVSAFWTVDPFTTGGRAQLEHRQLPRDRDERRTGGASSTGRSGSRPR